MTRTCLPVFAVAAALSFNAAAYTLDATECIHALGSYPFRARVVVIPEKPKQGDAVKVCLLDGVYPKEKDGVTIVRDGNRLQVVVHDSSFSWSPNPLISIVETLPPLSDGGYTIDAYVEDYFTHALRAVQTNVAFTVDPAAVEFYNIQLGHYFMTSSWAEAQGIDQGAAGPGWTRTGEAFRIVTAPPPGGQFQPVYRYYGSMALDAAGRRIGPNSHFYTQDVAERAAISRDIGWILEGIAFYGLPPAGGDCPAGSAPLYRLYNGRAAQNDSNHRFTTRLDLFRSMPAQGWIAEGVAMCVGQ